MKYDIDVFFSGSMAVHGIEADDEAEAREIAFETFSEEYEDAFIDEVSVFITDIYRD